jgi:uncharacterized membrane protein YidH (DUF202 family)
MKQLGLALVVLGIAALIVGVVGWERQTANIDLGGIKATATEHRTSPAATVMGVVSLVAGVALLISSKRRT